MRKSIWITTGIVAAAVGATAIVAHAERGRDGHGWGGHRGGYEDGGHGRHRWGRHRRSGERGARRRDMTKAEFDAKTRSKFARWDANSDGVVESAEAESHIASRMERRMNRRGGRRWERMLRRFDTDGDGKVTKAEIEARVTESFARMDLDSDGKITDADLPPMMRGRNILSGEGRMGERFHRSRRHGRRHGGRRGMRMMKRLIGADTNKDGEVTLQEMQDRASQRFARYDRNNDGVIEQADRDALRKEIVDYRVLRFMHRFGAAQDGKLTLEQFTKHRDERFARRDRDGNGVIERGERRRGGRGHDRGREHGRGGRRGGERGDGGRGN